MEVGNCDATTRRLRRGSELGDRDRHSKADRKRELDRLAQRANRERTKARIADLEERLASLESADRNGEIAQLTKTVGELRRENGSLSATLVKMRTAINEALGDVSEDQNSSSSVRTLPDVESSYRVSTSTTHRDHLVDNIGMIASVTDGQVPSTFSYFSPTALSQQQRLQQFYQTFGFVPPSANDTIDVGFDSWRGFFQVGPGAGSSWSSNPNSNPNSFPSSVIGHMPTVQSLPVRLNPSVAPDHRKWCASDMAFTRALQKGVVVDLNFDEAVLAKAILIGWESIGPHNQHPVFSTLRQIDQCVFGTWDSRPQRLAVMYLCACQMRWRAQPTEANKLKLPSWYLPRPAQDRIQHPVVIDFLPWPGLRERLVFEFERYTQGGEFSFAFVQYLHFYWPFANETAAEYDPLTGLVAGISKVFINFVLELKNWTMLPDFFVRFPEMRADIGMWMEQTPLRYG